MTNQITSIGARNYTGTQAPNPTNIFSRSRNPTTSDSQNYSLGDIWINKNNNSSFMLVSLAGNDTNHGVLIAIWLTITRPIIASLTGNTGARVFPDVADNINLLGDVSTMSIAGNTGTNTLTLSAVGSSLSQSITGNSGGAVHPTNAGNIILEGDGSTIVAVGNPLTNTLTFSSTSSSLFSLTGNTGGAVSPDGSGNINLVGDNIFIDIAGNAGTHTLTMSLDHPNALSTFTGDTGGAVSSGSGNTVNMIGGAGIVTLGTPASHTLTIDGGSDLATIFEADTGSATPFNHFLTVGGSLDIETVGSGDTLTIHTADDLSLTNVTVANLTVNNVTELSAIGEGVVQSNGSGVLSASKGTDGQLLIGSTAGAPAWANITAGSGISIINAANSITISKSGTAGGNGWVKIGNFPNNGVPITGIPTSYRSLAIVVNKVSFDQVGPAPQFLRLNISDDNGATYYTSNYLSGTFSYNARFSPAGIINNTITNGFILGCVPSLPSPLFYHYYSCTMYLYDVNNSNSIKMANVQGSTSCYGSNFCYPFWGNGAYTGPLAGPINALVIIIDPPLVPPVPPFFHPVWDVVLYGLTH